MPIYTYACPEGHRWEEYRESAAGSETSEGRCPGCPQGEGTVEQHGTKTPSTFGIVFRGTGWTPTFYPNRKGNK